MLRLSKTFLERPIMSLQTGAPVGSSIAPIFNPNNLKIEGFYCDDRFESGTKILLAQDIREMLPQGFVVNDHHALTDPDELIRLQKILKLEFELIGKPVYTEKKNKIGKVTDYATDDQSFYVQKLYVSRPIIKSLGAGQLSVDRTQIIEITKKKIIIKDILAHERAGNRRVVTAPAA